MEAPLLLSNVLGFPFVILKFQEFLHFFLKVMILKKYVYNRLCGLFLCKLTSDTIHQTGDSLHFYYAFFVTLNLNIL